MADEVKDSSMKTNPPPDHVQPKVDPVVELQKQMKDLAEKVEASFNSIGSELNDLRSARDVVAAKVSLTSEDELRQKALEDPYEVMKVVRDQERKAMQRDREQERLRQQFDQAALSQFPEVTQNEEVKKETQKILSEMVRLGFAADHPMSVYVASAAAFGKMTKEGKLTAKQADLKETVLGASGRTGATEFGDSSGDIKELTPEQEETRQFMGLSKERYIQVLKKKRMQDKEDADKLQKVIGGR